jgi:hypothetical protein
MTKVSKRGIYISDDLRLPRDVVTQTLAVIARKGGGKTYFGQLLNEGMLEIGAQTIAVDSVGNWFSLRIGRNGRSPGYDVYVFGGEHGDLPLTPDSGARIAQLVTKKRISCVLDVSAFRKGERKRFCAAFAEELFHLKKSQRSPLHLFLEEAQKLVPQVPEADERQMLGAFEDIVRLGRNYGIGSETHTSPCLTARSSSSTGRRTSRLVSGPSSRSSSTRARTVSRWRRSQPRRSIPPRASEPTFPVSLRGKWPTVKMGSTTRARSSWRGKKWPIR